MATKKISELEAINAAEDNDVLVIVDTSESTTNKITKGNLLIGAGHTIEMTLNENYQIVLVLKNAAGTALSTQTIDLPNENAITNLVYNNGILTVTKQSGATSQINLTGLIEGLVTESDFNTFKEALQTTLEAINEKDAEQDEAIAENYKVINKLNEKLENQQKVIDQLPQVEGQGTEVTLENTIEAPFTKFDVEGNSTQETTTGKNLANIHVITNLSNQFLSRQIVGDTIVLSNNTNSSGYLPTEKNLNEICPNLKVDDIVKLSFKTTSTTAQPTNAIYLNGINQLWRINEVKTITQEMLDSKVILYGGYNETAVISEFMIRLSSITDDTYEKFTYGVSPNPNYEQPIESAGDNENEFDGVILSKSTDVTFSKGKIVIPKYTNNTQFITFDTNSYQKNIPYTVSFKAKSTVDGALIRFDGQPDSATTASNLFPDYGCTINKEEQQFSITGQMTEDFEGLRFFRINSFAQANTSEIEIYDIKIEQGNKASGYSPYGMGSINEKIQTRNLFDKNNIIIGKRLDGSGLPTVTDNDYFTTNYFIKIKPNTIYHLTSIINQSKCICCYDKNKNFIERLIYLNTYTFTTTNDTAFIKISMKTNEIDTLQLEPGSTATQYVEHEEQDYSIFVQQPMRSIGDVRDCFVKVDGNWYERHYIGRKIFDGTETFDFGDSGVSGIKMASFLIQDMLQGNFLDGLCNYFHNNKSGKDKNSIRFGANTNRIYIHLDVNEYPDKATFSTWLAEKYANGTPVYVDYILAEPLDLPCTEEQIQQLENLPSTYKDFTIIQSEDETEAYLEVSGIYDLNKLITRVEVIESEV